MLSTHVANKIAAGEVVERPASVVKELLENALDAGATRIDIVVTAGGRRLVSVADNGSGMNRDDAIMAVERQATSKIRDVDDIETIATLGFRGEALASIASVSRFTLGTRRPEDDSGTEVTIIGGTLQDVRDCGCPSGTCIEVRDLFFNVPARRKFLRAYD
ncbi:MAG: DNA mismatch repair endonuclease MutL [Kiritimatiellia bacterium]